jgi:hypothetical protein
MVEPGEEETVEILVPSHREERPREGAVIRDRLAHLDADRERLFRINCGTGWAGRVAKHTTELLVLQAPRPLRAAPTGWPDLCGWETVTVTPEMVGRKIAVFVGEEIKCSGSLRPEQKAFRDLLVRMGGIHRVIRP